MIHKKLDIPLRVYKDQALLRRLPLNHDKRSDIEEDQKSRESGYRGEHQLQYYLQELPDKDFHIFNDLRLPTTSNTSFQIDSLVISSHLAVIIEVKHMSGTLFFDNTFNQLIQTKSKKERAYLNPLAQVRRQKHLLERLMQSNQVHLPIDYLVVSSNAHAILKAKPENQEGFQKVIRVEQVLEKILSLHHIHPKPMLTLSNMNKIMTLLLNKHNPVDTNILKTYSIDVNNIICGVQCPACKKYSMTRKFGEWYCSICQCVSKKAHKQALLDYFLLFGSKITNRQCRDFLHLTSRKVAWQLLKDLNLPSDGENRTTFYTLSFDKLYDAGSND
ncbi:nuclease-related domain-containing protein [Tuberibacillus sp. Marseille-P3662]|uniref:nuclease-related domain-containing protein n=1 Tax=Tuberibacillus sp. Marseille-P3662 TaxID=1965358 RepID=UPI000A1CDD94|nr:nuclease-related domain-containing protein [Tuberibacillus sp. Marseille-P3662]